jgi:predicted nucleic acid-binding protein
MKILVDTTVWIDFFHERKKSITADILQELIIEENDIFICPVIYQEVLQRMR